MTGGSQSVFDEVAGSRSVLVWVALSQLLALSLWFSASAVGPQLADAWKLDTGQIAGLTSWVQLGFVVGAIISAVFNLADVIPSRRLFVSAAVVGAIANLGLLAVDATSTPLAAGLRFVTGVALAGVYPSGLKVMAGWFRRGRGMALGILVGALTIGSASPHLVRGIGLAWQQVIIISSIAALVAAAIMLVKLTDGPFDTAASAFDPKHIARIARNRQFRNATVGYLGHMWELYAFWTWVAVFIAASATAAGTSYGSVSSITFLVIAIGAVGSWIGGLVSDRKGRGVAAGGSLLLSGTMALLSPVFFGRAAWIVIPALLIWGVSVVADSAQFSVAVTEVTMDDVRGTALTLQTALGFLLTLVSIRFTPAIGDAFGWRWAFLWLALGPIVGVWAMRRFRIAELRKNQELAVA